MMNIFQQSLMLLVYAIIAAAAKEKESLLPLSTSLASSLIAVCSQLGHFTFVKITLWSSFVLAHYGISSVLADYPLLACSGSTRISHALPPSCNPGIACADRVLAVILLLHRSLSIDPVAWAVAVIWIFSCQQRYVWLYFSLNVAVFQQRLSLTLQEVLPLLGLAAQLTADQHWE
jgi:hypothetical protein